jgi:hypothetical protein
LLAEEKLENAHHMYEARQHSYSWERLRHFLFFNDKVRKVTDAECVWEEERAKTKARKKRQGVQKWNPFHIVEQKIEQAVGGNVSQVFIFYQVILLPAK